MRALKSLFIYLAPVVFAYLVILSSGRSAREESLPVAIVMIIIGALISGGSVASHIHRGMKGEANGLKIVLGALAFLVTAAAYFALAFYGLMFALLLTSGGHH